VPPLKTEVTGLKEFQRSLRELDSELPRGIRIVLNKAAELVIDYARPRMPSRTGRARASLKPRSSQREARVALGGSRAPYAPWLDFGGEGRKRGRPTKRPFISEGRYVYRGLAVHRADITELMSDELAALARGAGLEVT
jgi:hypothetical protein